ncbi:MAG: SBBP repeat-containing protein [Bacteroidetes bacterium]|nr:SBBP repeat-containing protein [Bacteroidota bacterium]
MKKTLQVLTTLLIITFSSTAQNLDWVKQVGSTGDESSQQIATDNQGNIFIAGRTNSDSLNIFGTTISTQVNSLNKIFIIKCDSSTNILWANFYGTSGSNISDICVDRQGNCILIGYCSDSLFLYNDTLSAPTFDPTGFILSLNPTGGLNWYRHLSSTCELNPRKIVTDYAGNIYTCGRFYCNGQFDTISVNTVGYENFYIAKFSSGGNGLWVKNGTGRNMRTLDYSSTGIVSACTQYYDTLTVGNTTIYANNPYETSAIISYDSTGNLELIMNIGHGATGSSSSFITGLSSDILNNIYISGTFDSTNIFMDTTINSYGENDLFILKLNSNSMDYSFNKFGGLHNDLSNSLFTND